MSVVSSIAVPTLVIHGSEDPMFPLEHGHALAEEIPGARLLTLEDAVRKMTSLNAAKLGIMDRGLLRAGLFADITIFDAARVIDRATYVDPFQYNEGIEYVVVNGQVVLDHGKHTGLRPGRALRHRQ